MCVIYWCVIHFKKVYGTKYVWSRDKREGEGMFFDVRISRKRKMGDVLTQTLRLLEDDLAMTWHIDGHSLQRGI